MIDLKEGMISSKKEPRSKETLLREVDYEYFSDTESKERASERLDKTETFRREVEKYLDKLCGEKAAEKEFTLETNLFDSFGGEVLEPALGFMEEGARQYKGALEEMMDRKVIIQRSPESTPTFHRSSLSSVKPEFIGLSLAAAIFAGLTIQMLVSANFWGAVVAAGPVVAATLALILVIPVEKK